MKFVRRRSNTFSVCSCSWLKARKHTLMRLRFYATVFDVKNSWLFFSRIWFGFGEEVLNCCSGKTWQHVTKKSGVFLAEFKENKINLFFSECIQSWLDFWNMTIDDLSVSWNIEIHFRFSINSGGSSGAQAYSGIITERLNGRHAMSQKGP